MKKMICSLLIALTAWMPMASAEMIRMPEALGERAALAQLLQGQGVSAQDATARAAALTDEEAAILSKEMERLPAGGIGGVEVLLVIAVAMLAWWAMTRPAPSNR